MTARLKKGTMTMDASYSGSLSKQESLALRYGPNAIPAAGPWNDHIALLMSHRSVRGYRPDALPEGTLETLVAAAQSAATSSNLQTWSVIAVTDPAKKAAWPSWRTTRSTSNSARCSCCGWPTCPATNA